MRVVAGTVGGRTLRAPAGRATRPTSDRVRESIFDILSSLGGVAGATVADLFAGSGALGIEALSRGAAAATFVERDRRAAATITVNLEATGLAGAAARVVVADVVAWLSRAPACDVVLVDPPYAYDRWPAVLAGLVGMAGLVVLETPSPLELGADWDVLRVRRYGGTVVTVGRPAPGPGPAATAKGGM